MSDRRPPLLNCPLCREVVRGGNAHRHFRDHRDAADRAILAKVLRHLDVMPASVREACERADQENERVCQAEDDFAKLLKDYEERRG